MSASSQYYSVTARVGVPHRHEVEVTVPLVGPAGATGPAGAAGASAWNDITGKPSTFAPSAHSSSHHTGGSDPITPANIGAAQAVAVIQLASDETNTITTAQLPALGIGTSDNDPQTFTINLPTPTAQQSGLTFSIKRVEGVQEPSDTFFTVNHASVALLNEGELDSSEGSIDFLWDGHAWSYSGSYNLRSFPGRVLALPTTSGTLALTQSNDDLFRVVGSLDATKKVAFEVDTLVSTATTRTLTVPNSSGTIALNETFAAPPAIGNATPSTGAFTTLSATPAAGSTALTLTGGTVTASAPLINATQTWNASGTTFTALRLNATNTASASASLLMDLQTGGTTQFSVRRDGTINAASYYRFTGLNSGLFVHSAGGGIISIGASPDNWMTLSNSRMQLTGDLSLGRALSAGQAGDTILVRDDAGMLAQRNAANAQTFRIYGQITGSDTSATGNYERGFMRWSAAGGVFQIGTEKGSGGGLARALEFQTDGVTRMVISATGDVGIASTSAPTGGFGSAVIGQLNTASGNATYVVGRDSIASSTWAVALAYRSLADRNAMLAFAAGRFASNGDAQNAKFVLKCKTTTNAAVEMYLGDTTTTYLTIPSGKVIFCNIKVVGVKSDGSVVATYERQYAAKNVAGTSSEVYADVNIGTDKAASTSLEIATVDAGDYIRIRPTGIASETWRWVATVDAVEVAYGA